MSYSFSVRAATKAQALAAVTDKFAEVVLAQPVHAGDQQQALGCATVFIDLLMDDGQDVLVSMNGSIWKDQDGIKQTSICGFITKRKALSRK